jgi:23S rRNA (pseudouridine1915-N3)-methyltransferase
MRILILAVGRMRRGPEARLAQGYAERLRWPVAVREVEIATRLAVRERRAREGRALSALLEEERRRGPLRAVALDQGGTALSSEAFAARLGRWREAGVRTIAFVIGGAEGLDPEVTARADFSLSLGPMTWPHLLARGLLLEQLYRAQQILSGHPYHRG